MALLYPQRRSQRGQVENAETEVRKRKWAIPVNKGTPPLRSDNYVLGGILRNTNYCP